MPIRIYSWPIFTARNLRHWNIIKPVIVTYLSYIAAIALFPGWELMHGITLATVFLSKAFWCGYLYTHVFEWIYHRVIMHMKIEFRKKSRFGFAASLQAWIEKTCKIIRADHIDHHRYYPDDNLTTEAGAPDDRERLEHIGPPARIYPILFFPHFFVGAMLVILMHWNPVALAVFFAGVTQHYADYETAHWFIHAITVLDRIISRIPILRNIWKYWRKYHLDHHEDQTRNFSFTIPFLPDWLYLLYLWLRKNFFRQSAGASPR